MGVNGKKSIVIGSSIGGGKIQITNIEGVDVEFNGEYSTLITGHLDKPGVVAKVTILLASYNVNIAFMKVFRHAKGEKAMLVIETDENIPDKMTETIQDFPHVVSVIKIEKINV